MLRVLTSDDGAAGDEPVGGEVRQGQGRVRHVGRGVQAAHAVERVGHQKEPIDGT